MHGARAALDVARHTPGLPLQVKAQTHAVQMPEHLQRNAARRTLRGLGKDQIAQLGEQRGAQPQSRIGHQQTQRNHQHGGRCVRARCQGVHQGFEQQGHTDVGQLGTDHETQRQRNPPLVSPQIREKALQRGPVASGRIRGGSRRDRRSVVGGRAHGRQWNRFCS